jgi:hypothetical protein
VPERTGLAESKARLDALGVEAASQDFKRVLSLSEIKFEHANGVIRRESVSGECARRPDARTWAEG